MLIILLFFHPEKEGAISLNNKGFSLIETLVASSVIFILIATIVPITSLLNNEREILIERRLAASKLHDEFQPIIWNNHGNLPLSYKSTINSMSVLFSFTFENDLIKGCVKWKNAKDQPDSICLYGFPPQ